MRIKLGIVTPVAHMNPRFDPPGWEATGTVADVVRVCRAAEDLGYDWVSCSEHIAIPEAATSVRGGRYWDPFSTFGYLAAVTERIGLLTHMVVLPYHHPLELVKRLGTLDLLSDGRVILGVGVGSLEPEFQVLGHPFEGRGERADDAIRAIRASWGERTPRYHGSTYRFEGFIVEPSGLPRAVPVFVGGRTRRSLRRAIELGDAWMPFRLLPPELGDLLADPAVRRLLDERAERSEGAAATGGAHVGPLDLIFAPEPPLDPLGDRDGAARLLRSHLDAGATGFSLRFRNDSPDHYVEQMAATAALVAELAD
jgi:probable F420-dependent oxidoreductase